MPIAPWRATALALLLAAVACQPANTPAPAPGPVSVQPPRPVYTSGEEVITAMRDRYAGRWYRSLVFTQKTGQRTAAGTWTTQTWYEALRLPGRLRIDFDPLKSGTGVLYARDSQYVFANGKVTRADAGINDLLLLGFDVYANTTGRTAALLRGQGVNLARVHRDSLEGRPMIVVGALPGDLRSKQFWIDAERLYFVRLVEPSPRDTSKTQDIRFVNYQRFGDAWVASRVELYNDGVLVFTEDYSDIRTDVPLDDALFDPARWRSAKHWLPQ